VGEQRALERDDGPAADERVGDLGGEAHMGGRGGFRNVHPVIMVGSR
jgi:hypothetical protein